MFGIVISLRRNELWKWPGTNTFLTLLKPTQVIDVTMCSNPSHTHHTPTPGRRCVPWHCAASDLLGKMVWMKERLLKVHSHAERYESCSRSILRLHRHQDQTSLALALALALESISGLPPLLSSPHAQDAIRWSQVPSPKTQESMSSQGLPRIQGDPKTFQDVNPKLPRPHDSHCKFFQVLVKILQRRPRRKTLRSSSSPRNAKVS